MACFLALIPFRYPWKASGATLSVESGVQEIKQDSPFEVWLSTLFLEQQNTQIAVFSKMAFRSWGVSNHSSGMFGNYVDP